VFGNKSPEVLTLRDFPILEYTKRVDERPIGWTVDAGPLTVAAVTG
jgi:hypothetical protein